MTMNAIKVRMTPSHPGSFFRTEVMEELGLTVSGTVEILGVRRAKLSALSMPRPPCLQKWRYASRGRST